MKNWLKDLEIKMENKGEELVVSIKGDKEKIATLEKKLKVLKELCDCNCHCC